MNGFFNKIIGWVLIIAGVAIIIYAVYASFNIFTGAKNVPRIFKLEQKQLEKQVQQEQQSTPKDQTVQEIQEQVRKLVEGQVRELLPAEFLEQLFNLIAWALFAGLLIFAGGQLAGLGAKLLKTD